MLVYETASPSHQHAALPHPRHVPRSNAAYDALNGAQMLQMQCRGSTLLVTAWDALNTGRYAFVAAADASHVVRLFARACAVKSSSLKTASGHRMYGGWGVEPALWEVSWWGARRGMLGCVLHGLHAYEGSWRGRGCVLELLAVALEGLLNHSFVMKTICLPLLSGGVGR